MSLRTVSPRVLAFLLAGAALPVACATSENIDCKVGADCASGVCNADGTCKPVSTETGGGGTGGDATGGTGGGDGGTMATSGTGGDGGTGAGGGGVCKPNNDGTIEALEVPLGPGLSAKFKVATDATFDTTGDKQPDGSRIWDFAATLSGDHTTLAETLPIEGAWYANDFAGATYATRLSDSADLLGVFEVAEDALLLRGVVSPEDGFSATNLSYDPPVVILAFPMKEGDGWETTSTVSGLASGVFASYTETYTSKVDAHGKATTPYADFPVLRVGTDLTRVGVGIYLTTRTYAFVTECFGNVATVVSQYNETGEEFTSTSEVRRLSK